jgi:U3 small nucleolar RNA-associated protein 11
MMSERSRAQGKHGARDSAAARGLSHEAIKLLKTQDAGYLRTVGERVRRELEKVEQDVQLQEGMRDVLGEGQEEEAEDEEDEEFDFGGGDDDGKKGRRLVFADDRKEQRKLRKQALRGGRDIPGDEEDDSFEQVQRRNQKVSRKQLEVERQALVEERRARKARKRAAQARQNKLVALQKQHSDIVAAERELDWQRGKLDNSVGGTNKNGTKWKIRERKK